MRFIPKLVGEKCFLAPCSPESAQKWAEWLNDIEVAISLGDEAYTALTLEKIQEDIKEIARHQYHVFDIVERETDTHIGRCLLFGIDHVDRRGMLGIFIGEKTYWNKGYGQDAVRLLLDYGFNLLNLNNIMLGTFSFNRRAINCYKNVGFREIGRRRQARIIAGKKHDVVFMDILAEEFESVYIQKLVAQN